MTDLKTRVAEAIAAHLIPLEDNAHLQKAYTYTDAALSVIEPEVRKLVELMDGAADLLHGYGSFRYEDGIPKPFNEEAQLAEDIRHRIATLPPEWRKL